MKVPITLSSITIILLSYFVINACTAISYRSPDLKLVGRNWDFGDQDNSIQFIPKKNRNAAVVLFYRKQYVTDGINEHGVCISFTGVPDSPRRFVTPFKRWNISVHIIRDALKRCKNTNDVKSLFNHTSIWWGRPWGQQIAFLVADSAGNSCIIDYIDKKMVVTEMTDSVLILLNHHPSRPDILYKKFGCGYCEREQIIRKSIKSVYGLSEKKLMDILSEVSIADGMVRGFKNVEGRIPWGLNTAFSNVYNLKSFMVTTVPNRNYEMPLSVNLHDLMMKCRTAIKINLDNYNGEESFFR